ncbi:MAG TPA: TAXI family TRAP transporter solute-binding subunit [Candidatus Binatia bacterium]|nr:TAXI family TRAP transporter solute-binding subunit [Candidatus Binatia bacterium]
MNRTSPVRHALTAGLAGLLLVPVLVASATRVSIGTGPWSGTYFPVGEALAKTLNKHIPGMEASPRPAAGSAHALELVDAGEVSLAIVGLATAHFGVRGQREFTRKYDNVGFVMAGMDAGQSLVTSAGSGIKTFGDVKGLRLAANAPASKALLLAALQVYGVKEADVKLTLMSFGEQIAALRDETIDAAFLPVSPRNADVASLASERPVRILGFDSTKAALFEALPDWTPVAVKARTYPGQTQDLLVPGTHTALLAHRQADSSTIYRIVKTIIEHHEEFGDLHPGGREFTLDRTRFFVEKHLVPIAFHPGAEQYWREMKVLR